LLRILYNTFYINIIYYNILLLLLGRIQMQLKGLCWIGNQRARGREEDQRRPGGVELWKRHREKEGHGGR
jgi:hypothetical protein